jgi:hypothetical protein
MAFIPICSPRIAALRDRVRRDLEREQRRLDWIERGPPVRKALARRTRVLIAAYQQLDGELTALSGQDESTFETWLKHVARVGAIMKAKRLWPWWIYTRMVDLAAAPMKTSGQVHECMGAKDKRGAG